MVVVIIVVVIVALLAIALAVSYNRFVRQRNLVRESWRQIDVELQRRHDLIPNLVATVKGYATQESTVLRQVTEARTAAMQARQSTQAGPEQMARAENTLQRSLGGLFAVAESYPDLKSNQNFLELQRQIADTEDRIAAGRRFYNGNVRAINTRVEAFPSRIVASTFHFTTEQYFEVDDPQVRSNVAVDFSSLSAGAPAAPAVSPTQAPPAVTPGQATPAVSQGPDTPAVDGPAQGQQGIQPSQGRDAGPGDPNFPPQS